METGLFSLVMVVAPATVSTFPSLGRAVGPDKVSAEDSLEEALQKGMAAEAAPKRTKAGIIVKKTERVNAFERLPADWMSIPTGRSLII